MLVVKTVLGSASQHVTSDVVWLVVPGVMYIAHALALASGLGTTQGGMSWFAFVPELWAVSELAVADLAACRQEQLLLWIAMGLVG